MRRPRDVKDRADEFGIYSRKWKVLSESRSTDRVLTRPARFCASVGQQPSCMTEDLREREPEAFVVGPRNHKKAV